MAGRTTAAAASAGILGWGALLGACAEPPPDPAVLTPEAAALARRLLTDLGEWDAASSEERLLAARHADALLPDFRLREEAPLETFSCGGQTHEIAVLLHRPTGMDFSLIPVGTFDMGSAPDEPGFEPHEAIRRVTLTQPFVIARTEVTRAVWMDVMGWEADGAGKPESGAAFVRWIDVSPEDPGPPANPMSKEKLPNFCERTGLRLPTEAEWGYACRAGTRTAWCTGADERDLPKVVANSHFPGPVDVRTRAPNAFGLFDVHGNAWELCSDRWTRTPDPNDLVDPRSKTESPLRTRRGGGLTIYPPTLRSGRRTAADPLVKEGFRPVATVPLP